MLKLCTLNQLLIDCYTCFYLKNCIFFCENTRGVGFHSYKEAYVIPKTTIHSLEQLDK